MIDLIKQELYKKAELMDPNELNKEMIEELVKHQTKITEINYCSNPIVDAILYNKKILAKKYGIETKIQVITPDKFNIAPIDLVSLFSNLIDNAIEATIKSDSRFINIECYPINNHFVIKVGNTKCKEDYIDIKKVRTTKNNSDEHGLGIQIIKNIILKYDGIYEIRQSDNYVSFEIIINNI